MEFKEILERVAIKHTENRRNTILEILQENDIPYTIHTIEKSYPIYTSNNVSWDNFLFHNFDDEPTEYAKKYYYNILIDIGTYEKSDKKILLTAHYDVVSGSTGANDNGSSISILIKLILEKMYSDLPIRIAFLDGEEIGGVGSTGYINDYINTDILKQNVTVINFDVCGCGDEIVIEDKIFEINGIAEILKLEKILEKHNVLKANSLPFNDAKIFASKNINTMCIVALPKEDIELMNDKQSFLEPIGRKHFGSYVWEYQHNGKFDSIEYINYKMLQRIYDYISELF